MEKNTETGRIALPSELPGSTVFCVEVLYSRPLEANSVFKYVLHNVTAEKLRAVRRELFLSGLFVAVDPSYWRLIPPADFLEVNVYRQPSAEMDSVEAEEFLERQTKKRNGTAT